MATLRRSLLALSAAAIMVALVPARSWGGGCRHGAFLVEKLPRASLRRRCLPDRPGSRRGRCLRACRSEESAYLIALSRLRRCSTPTTSPRLGRTSWHASVPPSSGRSPPIPCRSCAERAALRLQTLLDLRHEPIAHVPIGIEALLAREASWIRVGSGVGQYSTSAASVCVRARALWCASGARVMIRSKFRPSQSSNSRWCGDGGGSR